MKGIETSLQIGIRGEENSSLNFCSNFAYNLLAIEKGIQTDEALNTIDNFINLLSEKQTQLGSTQNRLVSVLEEISIQRENLVSSRSTIRDADIAEVSSEYIKMQILQQASSTLLATANQTPSIALQLI
jgi:flagellin